MKNFSQLTLAIIFVALVITSCQKETVSDGTADPGVAPTSAEGEIIPGQYIVVFKSSKIQPTSKVLAKSSFTSREAKAKSVRDISEISIKSMNAILSDYDVDQSKVLNYYTTKISGMAIKLGEEEYKRLSSDPNVAGIEFDRRVQSPKVEVKDVITGDVSQKMAQETPCGISNAGGSVDGSGKNAWIWIIDSGSDLDHPDLNVVTDTR